MKIVLLLIIAAVMLEAKAQTSVYHPFPDSNAVWCGGRSQCWNNKVANKNSTYVLGKTVFINGHIYGQLKIYEQFYTNCEGTFSCSCLNPPPWSIDSMTYYIRQDRALKKVWLYTGSQESILYDFNLHVGDTLNSNKWYMGGN